MHSINKTDVDTVGLVLYEILKCCPNASLSLHDMNYKKVSKRWRWPQILSERKTECKTIFLSTNQDKVVPAHDGT